RLEFVELQEDIAIGAARDLALIVDGRDVSDSLQWSPRSVIDGQGRRKRRHIAFDTSWDQRIEIVEDEDNNRLRFVATTDRARAEETLATGQLRLADDFIRQACASTTSDAEVAKTLFEMLLPVGMKESAPDQRGIVLLLDEASARLPWELLEDRWSRNGRPPAITGGIVRQFKTEVFRERPAQAAENTVLLVGNPDLDGSTTFPDLPGAREEAQLVGQLFKARGWDSLELIDQKALPIVSGLHSRAWRVLHMAGHGEHMHIDTGPRRPDAGPRKPMSGMVIGNDVFLTPGDVEQMRYVPELVFINCCHLGKTGARKDPDYNRLAANLGLQFIRMGVRAVICAGWAVDDAAALTFSRTFYSELFEGRSLRDAVRRAREETHGNHPGVNTWGAYHCYGDPGWRLLHQSSGRERSQQPPYVSPRELIADLDNLVESARVRKQRDDADAASLSEAMRGEIEALKLRVPGDERDPDRPHSWLARADVAAGFGFAYGEGMLFTDAVLWLNRALSATEGDCPVRAVEQCANFRVRLAADEWSRMRAAGRQVTRQRHAELVEIITGTIQELDAINERAETAERLILLGGACKRLAWVQPDPAPRIEALLNMAQYYRRAFDLRDGDDAFALTNWGIACLLLAPLDAQRAAGDWRSAL
ncbi:MAG: CHAT domain-containing protein, partial [Chitinophagaceae bacterium]|nr:CHAT domain-containing protein [Rubrivivax sp.]